MSVPNHVIPLITEVWRLCDPAESVSSARRHKIDLGTPPKTLQIFESAEFDWEKGHCKKELLRGWTFDGNNFTELSPVAYPDYSQRPNGMYWHIGLIQFCVDSKTNRAVYTFVLGPRYGRGYKRTFAPGEEVRLVPDNKFVTWVS